MTLPDLAAGLRRGAWLTRSRIRTYASICVAIYAAMIIFAVATGHAGVDRLGRPVGTDFSSFWVAGRSALAGHPDQPYNPALQAAAERAAFPASSELADGSRFYSFAYPPFFLLLLAPLALLPYLMALLAWLATTLALYAGLMWRILPRVEALLAALAFPAVMITLGHGQNAFLTAALLGFGVLALPKRPLLAGIMFGLLAYKPQFGIALPVALLVGGHWRAIAAASLTVCAMTLATLLAFGVPAWQSFRAGGEFARVAILEQGEVGWAKMQSLFAAVRMLGGGIGASIVAQAVLTLVVLAALAWLWRGKIGMRLRAAGLLTASLLATPFCLDYDMVVLAPALALMVSDGLADGFAPWERSLLALVWVAPILARPAATMALAPLGLLSMLLLFGLILARARRSVTLASAVAA